MWQGRQKANDTVMAAKVSKGSIKIDGDLRDWQGHNAKWYMRSNLVCPDALCSMPPALACAWGGFLL